MIENRIAAAFDLDGTLLDDSKNIPDEFIEIANKKINVLIFVTGRNDKDAHIISKRISEYFNNFYVIYEDGQFVVQVLENDNYKELKRFPFLNDRAIKCLLEVAERDKLNLSFYSTESILMTYYKFGSYIKKAISLIIHNKIYYLKYIKYHPSYKSFKGFNVIKCVINGRPEELQEILQRLNNYGYNENAYYVINDERIEIKDLHSNKLSALLWLLQNLNISVDNCMYVGNGGNDIDCLRFFKNSYAVANSAPEAKQHAKHVVSSNNNSGVIEAINNYFDSGNY